MFFMSNPAWLEVSLTVDGELTEAVADVLARYIEGGIVIHSTEITDDPGGPGVATGPLKVCGYIPMDEQLEETKQKIETGLYYLSRIQDIPEPIFAPIQEVNWVDAWKKHYRPIPVGERLIILPAWFENPSPERTPIIIDPGMAFGTGTHPTTQLMLEMLDGLGNEIKGIDVIDVGSGSGILSIAALKLGAGRVLGVDVAVEALENARKNAELNSVDTEFLEIKIGSIDQILAGENSIRTAPVVIANIISPILIRLLDENLAKLVAPDGRLLLSGILEEREADMNAALDKHGLKIIERRQLGDWVALEVKE
jgi:ribosomal protein L11 methyltransferase